MSTIWDFQRFKAFGVIANFTKMANIGIEKREMMKKKTREKVV